MEHLVVVERLYNWPLHVPGTRVVHARSYLTDDEFSKARGLYVINLCRSYRYQSTGYYVSLLAEARGHKPFPSIATIQDLKLMTIIRLAGDDLDDLIQKSLAPLQSDEFVLSIYFGKNMAKRYERLCSRLFAQFRAPLLRVDFHRNKKWELKNVNPIAASDISDSHREFVVEAATEYLAHRPRAYRKAIKRRYDMAVLYDRNEETGPSDEGAIRRFVRAAEAADFDVELVGKDDYSRIAEFDALFIRETTSVNHHTYRFSRRAAAEGLVVIDDPDSILRCTNKVYLAELLTRHHIATPRTLVLQRENIDSVAKALGFPCILKQPDSSFSQGVFKVENGAELRAAAERLLERSEMIIAQEFVPTDFDWRVGVLNGEPLYVCRYYMAASHWQIVRRTARGGRRYGKVDAVPVDEAPAAVVRMAVKSSQLIGDGLYGVDLKEIGGRPMVIEVNDNPNIDSDVEDTVAGRDLYDRIVRLFQERIEHKKKERRR